MNEWLIILIIAVSIPAALAAVIMALGVVYALVMSLLLGFLGIFDRRAEQRLIVWMERR